LTSAPNNTGAQNSEHPNSNNLKQIMEQQIFTKTKIPLCFLPSTAKS